MNEVGFFVLCGLVGLYTGFVLANLMRELSAWDFGGDTGFSPRMGSDFVADVESFLRREGY